MQRDVKSKRGKEREVEEREGDEIRRSKEGGRQTPNVSSRATRFLTAAGVLIIDTLLTNTTYIQETFQFGA